MRHAPTQHFGLPGSGRNLIALQLPHDLQRAIQAVQAAARDQMLPAKQKALELCRRHRFDFTPQLPQREFLERIKRHPGRLSRG